MANLFSTQILLFLVTTPAYILLLSSLVVKEITTQDLIISRIIMGLIIVEFFADQQQWGKCIFLSLSGSIATL
jgi:hypothetical protein